MEAGSNPAHRRVVLVAHDNFTPRSRTPWGGTKLAALKGLGTDLPVIGESWEVSVEPSFPSAVADGSQTLSELIAADPDHWLGKDADLGSTSLLVKLLDTDEALSVQVHPGDDYAGLTADDSGKPESWYVVQADPGAGIHLGLTEQATPPALRACLEADGHLADWLTFVEVQEGDFFVVEAGTPHAIGPGLTLVEPQRVLPGRRGVTYRFWDWNRLYDADGLPSDHGEPRDLDIEAALDVTRFDRARGPAFIDRVRRRAGPAPVHDPVQLTPLADARADGALRFPPLTVGRIAGEGSLTLPAADHLRAITVVGGSITVEGRAIETGRSAVLAADGQPFVLQCSATHAIVSAAHPG